MNSNPNTEPVFFQLILTPEQAALIERLAFRRGVDIKQAVIGAVQDAVTLEIQWSGGGQLVMREPNGQETQFMRKRLVNGIWETNEVE